MAYIDVDVKFPTMFDRKVITRGEFNTENSMLVFHLESTKIELDLTCCISVDLESIRNDVERHISESNRPEFYEGYDINDIKLESVTIDGKHIQCAYTICAGDYRRVCSGMMGKIMTTCDYGKWMGYVDTYNGRVCW